MCITASVFSLGKNGILYIPLYFDSSVQGVGWFTKSFLKYDLHEVISAAVQMVLRTTIYLGLK